MGLLSGLVGRGRTLSKCLDDYPPFAWPHWEDGVELTAGQQQENFDWFMEHRLARIEAMRSVMAQCGFEVPAPADFGGEGEVSPILHEFSMTLFSKQRGVEKACEHGWRSRPASGRALRLLSFAIDMGIYCGECVSSEPYGWSWKVDDTNYKPVDRMPTSGNVTLYKRTQWPAGPQDSYHDLLDWTVYTQHNCAQVHRNRALARLNEFSFLDGFIRGGYG